MRGLFIGRFQPFHNGHLTIVEAALEEVEELVIGIGSAERSFTKSDPLTSGERYGILREIMKDRSWNDRVMIVPIRDVNRYSIWVSHVASLCPEIDLVFSNNPLTVRLFRESGYEIRSTRLVDRDNFSGESIRTRIGSGQEWEHLVPEAAVRSIKEKGYDDRIRNLMNSGDSR